MTTKQQEFQALRNEGFTYQEIGEMCGVSKQRVQFVLTKYVYKKPVQLLDRIVYPRVREFMLDEGLTATAMSKKSGIGYRELYTSLIGERELRKRDIDALLAVTKLPYEELFREEA